MIVLKFGGTSVGTKAAISKIKTILINEKKQKIVVCSAMSGVTDQLIELSDLIKNERIEDAIFAVDTLRNKHLDLINNLIKNKDIAAVTVLKIEEIFRSLTGYVHQTYQDHFFSIIITTGEFLLTTIVSNYLESEGLANVLLKAENFMSIDSPEKPDIESVGRNLNSCLEEHRHCDLFITQGFIYQKNDKKVGHLSRGGSDYSASIIGAAVGADEVQIWTDVDGVLNNDPRFIVGAETIQRLSYNEAAELAFFGAKILHPMTTFPLSKRKIPVQVRNTFNFRGMGTFISEELQTNDIKGVAGIDNINLLDLEFNYDNQPINHVKFIYDLLNEFNIRIDMSSSSRTSMLLAVRDNHYLDHVIKQLTKFCSVKINRNQTIISVVGNSILSNPKGLKIFNYLNCSDVRMIMYGGSKNSILILVDKKNKVKFLQMLNDKLFYKKSTSKSA